jgi:hypothetical protein
MGNALQEQAREELPEIAKKWAEAGSRIDVIAGKMQLSKIRAMPNFERAMVTAIAVQELKKALTPEVMGPVMALQGTQLGFRTDKDKDGGYPVETVRLCVIEAVLNGAMVTGNEFNIISDRAYFTKEYFERMVDELDGITDVDPTFGVPTVIGEVATVECECSWKRDSVPQKLTPGPGRQSGRLIPVRVNAKMIVDAILGKARRKLFKQVYEFITRSKAPDDGDVDASVVDGTAKDVTGKQPAGSKSDALAERMRRGNGSDKDKSNPPDPIKTEPSKTSATSPEMETVGHGSKLFDKKF